MSGNKYLNASFATFVAIFLITSATKSVHIISILLMLLLLAYYIYFKRTKRGDIFLLNRDERLLCLGLFCMFLSALPPLMVNDSLSVGLRELDMPIRYVGFGILALLLFKLKPMIPRDRLFGLICIGGIIHGIIAILHIFVFPNMLFAGRYEGYVGIGPIGFVCGIFSILNLTLYLFYRPKYIFRCIFLIASVFPIIGVIGSGLRGVALGVLFSLFVVLLIGGGYKVINYGKMLKIALVFLCLFGLVSYIVLANLPSKRLQYSVVEFDAISSGDYSTSVGQRLVMYKEALAIFSLSPLFGMSAKTQLDNAEQISYLSGFSKAIDDAKEGKPLYGKKHNDVLTFMAKRGIVGLAALVLFYLAWINVFYRRDFITFICGVSVLALCIGAGFSSDPVSGFGEATFMVLLLFCLISAKDFKKEGYT